jgi:hypothetical protein
VEIEFTLRKTDREWIPVEIKPSKPEPLNVMNLVRSD